jgi:hypothetical protein
MRTGWPGEAILLSLLSGGVTSAIPTSLSHALLYDFEFIGKYSSINHPQSIATAMAMLERTNDLEHWINVTRTEVTQEELDRAFRLISAQPRATGSSQGLCGTQCGVLN